MEPSGKNVLIAPSILAADFARLGEDVRRVAEAGADWIHVDVMDGHFVPNITIGPAIVGALRGFTQLPFDVHLMISEPQKYVESFAQAGSDLITFHIEVVKDPVALARRIRAMGKRAGLALNPGTPVEAVLRFVPEFDLVLPMSVEPGFGGQKFIEGTCDKLRKLRAAAGEKYWLEVDGGLGPKTVGRAAQAGANVIVAGTAVFGAPDVARAISEIRAAAGG
ncbi:MAG: ribulose-phosphate 3-epimerase [Planctomycetota bacterium]|nr:ribulose-phosphate 3-epimerase [Planctomycetota bacterium]